MSGIPIPEIKTGQLYFIGGVLILGVLWVAGRNAAKAIEAVSAFGEAVNPISQNNIFYRGSNELGKAIMGEDFTSWGFWLYDALHPQDVHPDTVKINPNPSPVDMGTLSFDELKNDAFAGWFKK